MSRVLGRMPGSIAAAKPGSIIHAPISAFRDCRHLASIVFYRLEQRFFCFSDVEVKEGLGFRAVRFQCLEV